MLPDCVAWIVQVPTATSVTVDVAAVQTAGVNEEKETGRLEDAVALTAKEPDPYARSGSALKVIVWLAGVTWKFWVAAVAG